MLSIEKNKKVFILINLLDIISNMKKETLADIITLNFKGAENLSDGGAKDIKIKVPKLEARSKKSSIKEKKPSAIKQHVTDINSILDNVLRNIGNTQNIGEKAEKEAKSDEVKVIEEKEESHGGYGTSRRSAYAAGAVSSYTDYGKLFSYLGAFKANSGQNIENAADMMNRALNEGNKFFFLDTETIDMGVKHIKYFNMGLKLSGDMSAVPMGGVNSKDWEMFKLWSKIDPVMYNLKLNTM